MQYTKAYFVRKTSRPILVCEGNERFYAGVIYGEKFMETLDFDI